MNQKRNLNTLFKVAPPPATPQVIVLASFSLSFVGIPPLRGRGPVDPKIPLTPETAEQQQRVNFA